MLIKNEMGVIVSFAQTCNKYGYEITSIQSDFPDAIIRKGENIYRTEFEYMASSFLFHEHDERECDLIICWKDDLKDLSPLPVIELSNSLWGEKEIVLFTENEKELSYWIRQSRIKSDEIWLLKNQINELKRTIHNLTNSDDY